MRWRRYESSSRISGPGASMPLKANQGLLCWFLCILVIPASCAPKKPIASPYAPFRLESLNHDSLLFTPSIPEGHASNTAVRVTLNGNASEPVVCRNCSPCSAERGPFRVEQGKDDPRSVQITLPAPARWVNDLEGQAETAGMEDFEALGAILADLDQLQQEGCFAELHSSIREFILQSLPIRSNVSTFNTYGYFAGRSGVDLKPGMRLKIERAYFRPGGDEEEHEARDFLGVSTMYFDVESTGDGKTRFQPVGNVRYSPSFLAHMVHKDSRDLGVSIMPQGLYYHLLFYTDLVSKSHTLSAAIIGARYPSQVDELDKELRAPSDKGCKNAAATRAAACFEFDGFVTLSALIKIDLNGKLKFVDWGTMIKDILPKNSEVKALNSLRIQRRFMNSYCDVRFDPRDSGVLSLALVNGDRLTWSKGSPTSTRE
jgi:hypothetical protein